MTRSTNRGHDRWYDFPPPSGSQSVPNHVKYLRIGFLRYQQLLQGSMTTVPFEIEANACRNHPNLKRVQIYLPVVSRILEGAFDSCRNLKKVEFLMKPKTRSKEDADEIQEGANNPSSQLEAIGLYAFRGGDNLKSVLGLEHAAESLQSIGKYAFAGCPTLGNVGFMSSLTQLQSMGTFSGCKSLAAVDLSKAFGVREFYRVTFMDCVALTSVQMPPNLLTIGNRAFYGCSALEQIDLPTCLQNIGSDVFRGCKKLTTIALPPSVKQIGWCCLIYCEKLSHVVLPSSKVSFLKKMPFNASCHSLSSLELPTPVRRKQWPIILEQFTRDDGIVYGYGSVPNPKNRNTIIWNFLRQNITQLFVQDDAAMSRTLPALET